MKRLILCITLTLTLLLSACAAVPPPQTEQILHDAVQSDQYQLSVHILDQNYAVIRLTDTQLKDAYEVDRTDTPDSQDEYGWYVQFGIYEIKLHHLKMYQQAPYKPQMIRLQDMELELYQNTYNPKGEFVFGHLLPAESVKLDVDGTDLVFTVKIPDEYYEIDLRTQGDIVSLQTMDCTRPKPYQTIAVDPAKAVVIDSLQVE